MTWGNPYFTNLEKINLLCRWITVHSIIYYEYNKNIVTDYMFDMNCIQLTKMINENKKVFKESAYYYYMYDFDGSTGMHIVGRLTLEDLKKYTEIADYNLRRHNK